MAAVQKLAQDERRPALGEDLSPTRYRAELRVMRHVPSQHLTPLSAQVHFLVFQRVHDTSIVPDGRKAPGRYGNMRIRFVLALLVVVATVAAYGGTVLATPIHGVTSTLYAIGQFHEIDAKTLSSSWQARINTKSEAARERAACISLVTLPVIHADANAAQRHEDLVVDWIRSDRVRVRTGRHVLDPPIRDRVDDSEHRAARIVACRDVVMLVAGVVPDLVRPAYL